jgi:DNA repair protein SbcD/Mre11
MKRMRIIHTADLHLDSSFASMGVQGGTGNRLRAAQRKVFMHILKQAQEWPADVVIIAGDLFDNANTEEATLAFVLESLEHLAPIQVYIAPGNRDPFTPDSPYALEPWPSNVTIFSPGEWNTVAHDTLPLTVHGFGCDGKDDSGTWFSKLEVPNDGRIHIAVAHGTERVHQPREGKIFAPFNVADIVQDNLAYLALGHFHAMTEITGDFKTAAWYPGTPQGRNFCECGMKTFLQAEVTHDDSGEASVVVRPIDASEVLFEKHAVDAAQVEASLLKGGVIHETGYNEERVVCIRLEGSHLFITGQEAIRSAVMTDKRILHVDIEDATTISADSLGGFRDNTCVAKLVQAMQQRILDEPQHGTVLQEIEALKLALRACQGVELSLPDITNVSL